MNTKVTNRHQWRTEMALSILTACDGDIGKAMKHRKMPYKKRSTVIKLARENGWYKNGGNPRPRSNRLTEEEIERIHNVFIGTDGYIGKTAQRTGFGKSTVSRYAKARGWHDELLQINKKLLNGEKEKNMNESTSPNKDVEKDDNEETMSKLKALRKMLFDQITGSKNIDAPSKSSLKLAPKTLSEAIKALIDIDKRISDREDAGSTVTIQPYQNILSRCAEIAKDRTESEN